MINQTPLVSYHGHVSHVMSGLWSPLDPDLIITGSADGTVQCWRMSIQTTTRPSDKKKSKNSAETAPVATCDVTSEELTTEVKGGNYHVYHDLYKVILVWTDKDPMCIQRAIQEPAVCLLRNAHEN